VPLATVVIPTYDRPRLVAEAVDSALAQTIGDHEIVVVDDASPEPVHLPAHPRLRVVRLASNGGGAAARNVGLAESRGTWITYLDDDDLLEPDHLAVALAAQERCELPAPVATLSATVLVGPDGSPIETRVPPTVARGGHFALEQPRPGYSWATKSTLVVERSVLRSIGGWDPAFRSRVHTELFLRLNPVCSILGLPTVTYRHRIHDGERVSDDPGRRAASMRALERKHRAAFAAHPDRHADMLFHQAMHLWMAGARSPALRFWARSLRVHPTRAGRRTLDAARDRAAYARDGLRVAR
jgi:glycosyltransferase involved in cell wall biosynthesis